MPKAHSSAILRKLPQPQIQRQRQAQAHKHTCKHKNTNTQTKTATNSASRYTRNMSDWQKHAKTSHQLKHLKEQMQQARPMPRCARNVGLPFLKLAPFVGAVLCFSGDWDVHWGCRILTHGHMDARGFTPIPQRPLPAAVCRAPEGCGHSWEAMEQLPASQGDSNMSTKTSLPPVNIKPARGSWKTILVFKGHLSGSMSIGGRVLVGG